MPLETKDKALFYALNGSTANARFEDFPMLWANFLLREVNGGSGPAEIPWEYTLDERPDNYGYGSVRQEAHFENGVVDIEASIEEYFFDSIAGARSSGPTRSIVVENDKGLKATNKGDGYWELQGPLDQRIAATRFIYETLAKDPRPEPEILASALGYRVDTLATQVTDMIAHGKPDEAVTLIEGLADLAPHAAVYSEAKALVGMYLNRPEWLANGIDTLQQVFSQQWEWLLKNGTGPELLAAMALMNGNLSEAEKFIEARSFSGNAPKPYSFTVYALVFLRLMRRKGWTATQQHEWLAGIMKDSLPMFAYSFNPNLREIETNA